MSQYNKRPAVFIQSTLFACSWLKLDQNKWALNWMHWNLKRCSHVLLAIELKTLKSAMVLLVYHAQNSTAVWFVNSKTTIQMTFRMKFKRIEFIEFDVSFISLDCSLIERICAFWIESSANRTINSNESRSSLNHFFHLSFAQMMRKCPHECDFEFVCWVFFCHSLKIFGLILSSI